MTVFILRTFCICAIVVCVLKSTWAKTVETNNVLTKDGQKTYRQSFRNHLTSQVGQNTITTTRRFLKSKEEHYCAWNTDTEECNADYGKVALLLASSQNSLSRFIANSFTCLAATDEASCRAESLCHWDEDICEFIASSITNPDSPCLKVAPGYFADNSATTICQKLDTSAECNAAKQCYWDEEDGCDADAWQNYFGFEPAGSFRNEYNKILDLKADTIDAIWRAQLATDSNETSWSRVLRMEVPQTICPPDANIAACVRADVVLRGTVPVKHYCRLRYSSEQKQECNQDALCEYDAEGEDCVAANNIITSAMYKAYQAISAGIPNEIDRAIIYADTLCPLLEEANCTGRCQWNVQNEECWLNLGFFAGLWDRLRPVSEEADLDPVCQFWDYLFEIGCYHYLSNTTCNSNERCEWTSYNECDLSHKGLYKLALSRANDLNAVSTQVWDKCEEHTNEDTCEYGQHHNHQHHDHAGHKTYSKVHTLFHVQGQGTKKAMAKHGY